MYKIIGADGREYGPVSLEQLRQWLAEGRANAQTLTQAVGTTDWKPLASVAGVTTVYSLPPVAPPLTTPVPDFRKSRIAAGLLGIFLGGWGIHRFYLGYAGTGIAQIIVTIFTCGIGALWGFIEGILILAGAINVDADGRPLRD